jgi:hypothetical protein
LELNDVVDIHGARVAQLTAGVTIRERQAPSEWPLLWQAHGLLHSWQPSPGGDVMAVASRRERGLDDRHQVTILRPQLVLHQGPSAHSQQASHHAPSSATTVPLTLRMRTGSVVSTAPTCLASCPCAGSPCAVGSVPWSCRPRPRTPETVTYSGHTRHMPEVLHKGARGREVRWPERVVCECEHRGSRSHLFGDRLPRARRGLRPRCSPGPSAGA